MTDAIGQMTAGRIRVAANAVVLRGDSVLLVEFDDESGLHYNFPGGGVEPGETLDEAVRREVREETTLDVRVERPLLVVESVASRNTNLVAGVRVPWNEIRFFFLCRAAPGAQARLPDAPDGNQTGVRWAPIESLKSLRILPDVVSELLATIEDAPGEFRIVANPHA